MNPNVALAMALLLPPAEAKPVDPFSKACQCQAGDVCSCPAGGCNCDLTGAYWGQPTFPGEYPLIKDGKQIGGYDGHCFRWLTGGEWSKPASLPIPFAVPRMAPAPQFAPQQYFQPQTQFQGGRGRSGGC